MGPCARKPWTTSGCEVARQLEEEPPRLHDYRAGASRARVSSTHADFSNNDAVLSADSQQSSTSATDQSARAASSQRLQTTPMPGARSQLVVSRAERERRRREFFLGEEVLRSRFVARRRGESFVLAELMVSLAKAPAAGTALSFAGCPEATRRRSRRRCAGRRRASTSRRAGSSGTTSAASSRGTGAYEVRLPHPLPRRPARRSARPRGSPPLPPLQGARSVYGRRRDGAARRVMRWTKTRVPVTCAARNFARASSCATSAHFSALPAHRPRYSPLLQRRRVLRVHGRRERTLRQRRRPRVASPAPTEHVTDSGAARPTPTPMRR